MARYSVYVKTNDKLFAVPFKMANGKEKTKYDLEELDLFFAKPSNTDTDALQKFLNRMMEEGKITENPQKVFIGCVYDGLIRPKDIIKNDPFVYEVANYYIEQKFINKKNPRIPKYDKIEVFINEIRDLAINDNKAFRSMYFSNLFPKHVYDILNDYRNTLKKDYSDKENDLKEIKEQLDYNIRKYNYFRSIYLWKQSYDKKKDKQDDYSYDYDLTDIERIKDETTVDYEEEVINKEEETNRVSVTDFVKNKDNYSNLFDWAEDNSQKEEEKEEVMDNHQYERKIYEEAKEELQQIAYEYTHPLHVEITNPLIDYYFKQGGINSVLANCSLDDIEALSDEEKRYIGYRTNKTGR